MGGDAVLAFALEGFATLTATFDGALPENFETVFIPGKCFVCFGTPVRRGGSGAFLIFLAGGGLGGAEHFAEAEDAWLAMKVAQCMGAADPSLQMWALPGSFPFMSVQDSEGA